MKSLKIKYVTHVDGFDNVRKIKKIILQLFSAFYFDLFSALNCTNNDYVKVSEEIVCVAIYLRGHFSFHVKEYVIFGRTNLFYVNKDSSMCIIRFTRKIYSLSGCLYKSQFLFSK